jgi:ABC-type glycerol-3-phosphate transport system substrate-binding protein
MFQVTTKKEEKMRFKIIKIFSVSIGMLVIMGAISLTFSVQSSAKKVELTMWWWGEQDNPGLDEYFDSMARKYEELNPEIKLNVILQGTDEVVPAVQAADAAQEGPNIMTLWGGVYMMENVWEGDVYPVSNLIPESEYQHWLGLPVLSWNNQVWAVNLYGYSVCMSYNKDIFRKAGLNPDEPPKTWDQFLQVCKKVQNVGITPIAVGFQDGWASVIMSQFFSNQLLENPFTEVIDAVVGKSHFTDPEFADVWTRIKELLEKGYIMKGAASVPHYEAQQEVRAGRAAFVFAVPGQVLEWQDELGEEAIGLMMAPQLPLAKSSGWPSMGMSVYIPSYGEHKEQAADWLTFLHEPESLWALHDAFPGRILPADDRFDISAVENPKYRELYQYTAEAMRQNFYMMDYLLPWTIIDDGYFKNVQRLTTGEISPEETAKAIEEAAKIWRELNPAGLEAIEKW